MSFPPTKQQQQQVAVGSGAGENPPRLGHRIFTHNNQPISLQQVHTHTHTEVERIGILEKNLTTPPRSPKNDERAGDIKGATFT